ncbi:hypothetical protein HMPREF3187_01724 [Aerococcus christensenii]|uniref:Uncharacterized protein n=1 Tax=Aerococcus christensenii TaxID=87541 RepID=A0A133XQH6_9LACT|nr:hypothetical protein HMPREF3187_01724 [Aerococcus christensenii]
MSEVLSPFLIFEEKVGGRVREEIFNHRRSGKILALGYKLFRNDYIFFDIR